MNLDPLQAEYNEMWMDYGLLELPLREKTLAAPSSFVVGSGNPKASLFFVNEFSGQKDGEAEQLLTKIIEAMGYTREQIYLAKILKPSEIERCASLLKSQIDAVEPKVVISLGDTATLLLSGKETTLTQLRGKWLKLYWNTKINLLPTYSAAYLLDNPSAKKLVWGDMKLVNTKLT